jgi:hypothetical protein
MSKSRLSHRITAILLSLAVTMVGCSKDSGKKESGASRGPAKTAKEAAVNLVVAVEQGDKALFVQTMAADSKDKPMVEAMFEVVSAMWEFGNAYKKAYGSLPPGMSDMPPSASEFESKVQIEETGDTAKARLPGGKGPMDLVKKDGVWKVDMEMRMPDDPKARDEQITQAVRQAKAVRDVRTKIGKPGMTGEKIMEELGKAMSSAFERPQPIEVPGPDDSK